MLEKARASLKDFKITEMLGVFELQVFGVKVGQHRNQFPYSNLKEALQDFR